MLSAFSTCEAASGLQSRHSHIPAHHAEGPQRAGGWLALRLEVLHQREEALHTPVVQRVSEDALPLHGRCGGLAQLTWFATDGAVAHLRRGEGDQLVRQLAFVKAAQDRRFLGRGRRKRRRGELLRRRLTSRVHPRGQGGQRRAPSGTCTQPSRHGRSAAVEFSRRKPDTCLTSALPVLASGRDAGGEGAEFAPKWQLHGLTVLVVSSERG